MPTHAAVRLKLCWNPNHVLWRFKAKIGITVTFALGDVMRYMNLHFIYLLTYLLNTVIIIGHFKSGNLASQKISRVGLPKATKLQLSCKTVS